MTVFQVHRVPNDPSPELAAKLAARKLRPGDWIVTTAEGRTLWRPLPELLHEIESLLPELEQVRKEWWPASLRLLNNDGSS